MGFMDTARAAAATARDAAASHQAAAAERRATATAINTAAFAAGLDPDQAATVQKRVTSGASVEDAIAAVALMPRAVVAPAPVRREVQVKTYKSGKDFEKDANKMLSKGWELQDQSTRTKKWSIGTGLLTNKGITTVTYVRVA